MNAAAFDPLLFSVDLPLRKTFYPHGFALELETNSLEAVEAAEDSWANFNARFDEPPIHIRVVVEDAKPGELPVRPVFRGQGHLVAIVSDARNFAAWDREKRFAGIWLSSRCVQDREWMRYHFLDALAYLALAQLYLTPLHAACVARLGSGVLLCGDSGAGKSSLAYACARRGWTYLADDAVSLVRGRGDRQVLGRPAQIFFRDDAVDLFPELAGRLARRRPNGDMRIEIPTAEVCIQTALECRADYVVLLHRRCAGPAEAKPVGIESALKRIVQVMPVLGGTVLQQQEASVRTLLAAQAFELEYADLASAVDCLAEVVGRRVGK